MTIANWNPDLTVPPGTSKASLNGHLTVPFAGGTAGTGSTPPAGMRFWLNNTDANVTGGALTWPDASPNHLTTTPTGTFAIVSEGGQRMVFGWSATSFVTIPGLALVDNAGWEIFIVCFPVSYAPNTMWSTPAPSTGLQVIIGCGDSGNGDKGIALVFPDRGTVPQVLTFDVIPLNQTVLIDSSFDPGGLPSFTVKASGQVEEFSFYANSLGNTTISGCILGTYWFTPANAFNGGIAEVLVYPRSQDKTAVRAYLNTKYGLAP